MWKFIIFKKKWGKKQRYKTISCKTMTKAKTKEK